MTRDDDNDTGEEGDRTGKWRSSRGTSVVKALTNDRACRGRWWRNSLPLSADDRREEWQWEK